MAQKRIDFISLDEFTQLYKAAKGNQSLRIAMLLGFGSGLRISEILGLAEERSKCCDAPLELMRVPGVVPGKKYKRYACTKCKQVLGVQVFKRGTTGWKIPPLMPDQIDIPGHKVNLNTTKGGKWRVTVLSPNFTEEMKNALPISVNRRTLQYQFTRLVKKELGKPMSFHILRHGFGNYHANVARTSLPIVQQLMGHSRLDTTGIYTKANPEEAIAAAWKGMGGA